MKVRSPKIEGGHCPAVKSGRVMKQQKLNFFTPAKKRTIAVPENYANNNKKKNASEDEENSNNNNESKTSRPRRSCNKENLDVGKTEGHNKDGKKEQKDKTIDAKKEIKIGKQVVGSKNISETEDKKKGKDEEQETEIKIKTSTKREAESIVKREDTEEDGNLEGEGEQIFSNSMKDAVKTECRICG